MTAHAISQERLAGRRSPAALLRLAGDERLVALTRAGNEAAFEVIVSRYQARLLSFCTRIVGSREDAEDVLQEVFTASFNALRTDEREINLRPWLYRIARNRSLNHLRRRTAIGVDSMDVHYAEMGISTSDKVFRREDFRLLVGDIEHLPESQRTALLLREIEGLSYDQIAEVMDQTISGIKSLLVRARMGLAESAESRKLTCGEVRLALAEAAEGVASLTQPMRRHVKSCEHCAGFRKHLGANNRALAALAPFAPLLLVKQLFAGKVGASAGGAGATVGGSAAAGGTAAVGGGTFGALTTAAVATKAVAAVAAAALLTAGTVAVTHHASKPHAAAVASAGIAEQVTTTSVFPTVRHLKRHFRPLATDGVLASATAPASTSAITPVSVSEQVTTTTVFPAGASGTSGATTTLSTTSAPAPVPTPAPQTTTPSTTAPDGGGGAPAATTGTTGASGPTSASGPVGATGQSGSTGPTGASGASGSSGATGSSGSSGSSGTSGSTGSTGG